MGAADFDTWPGQAVFSAFPKNPEKEQAVLRISLGSVVLLAYLGVAWSSHARSVVATLAAVTFYVAFGFATYIATAVAPARSRIRLTLTTLTDQATLTMVLAVGGQAALPLLWVVFWFLVGAGCRYGRRMLGLSCAVALCGIAALTQWQPWWRSNMMAGVGVALSVAATSIYLAVLVYRLEKQATTDPLTGLGNRVRLEQAIARTLGIRGADAGQTALFLVDLDGFKMVNDTYGHAVGDELLRSFAVALAVGMRRDDTLARLGGDEFVVLAHRVDDKEAAQAIANRIHAALNRVTTVGKHPVAVSGSIGICLVDEGMRGAGLDARTLMRAADSAMYRAKSRGRGQTAFAEAAELRVGA